jgi:hypothetical protein
LSDGRYCWTAALIGPRASKSYRITVRAGRGASGNRVNRATTSSPSSAVKSAVDAVRIVDPTAGVTG